MGPKKGKKPKKSKEEIEAEKKAKEEEEARLKAEEEKRLEDERLRREEEERLHREKLAKRRREEIQRLQIEYEVQKEIYDQRNADFQRILGDHTRKHEWKKYLSCEPRPDASVDAEINSFISTWSEDESCELEDIVKSSEYACQVIDDLISVTADAEASSDKLRSNESTAFVESLKSIIVQKIDHSTAHILQYADEYTEKGSKHEVKMEKSSKHIKVGLWINLIVKGFRNKRIEFPGLSTVVDIPKPVALQNLAVRIFYIPYDHCSGATKKFNIDIALSGIFSIELLNIPLGPKKIRGWTMREILNEGSLMERIAYPLEGVVASTVQAIKVQLELASDVVYPMNPRIGYWDQNEETWKEDGITEIQYTEETNTLYFHTIKLTSLAVLQRRDLHFMKTFWKLYVIGEEETAAGEGPRAHLYLGNEKYEYIHLEICEGSCRLVEPQLAALKPLNEEYHPPGQLIKRLAISGINLAPTEEEDEYLGTHPKDKHLEKILVHEVSTVASAFEISSIDPSIISSQWKEISSSTMNVALCIKERHPPNSIGVDKALEKPYHVLAKMDEEAPRRVKFFLETIKDEFSETHVSLRNALKRVSTSNAMDLLDKSSVEFEYTIRKVLKLVRPFSYCLDLPRIPTIDETTTFTDSSDITNAENLTEKNVDNDIEGEANPAAEEILPPSETQLEEELQVSETQLP